MIDLKKGHSFSDKLSKDIQDLNEENQKLKLLL